MLNKIRETLEKTRNAHKRAAKAKSERKVPELEITWLAAAGCAAGSARASARGPAGGSAGSSGLAGGSAATGGKGGNSPAGSAM